MLPRSSVRRMSMSMSAESFELRASAAVRTDGVKSFDETAGKSVLFGAGFERFGEEEDVLFECAERLLLALKGDCAGDRDRRRWVA